MNLDPLALAFLILPCMVLADLSLSSLDLPIMGIKPAPCRACVTLVDSFKKGMEKTAKGKHDGGDAEWENKRLKAYQVSEIRLTEIQETLCKDAGHNEQHCHTLASTHDILIEEWWFNHQDSKPDFHAWFCIEQLSVCCPPDHYGPNCDPCPNCNGNGACKGAGTRKGNGKCKCNEGYGSDTCNECATGYYESFRDESKLLCSACHEACDSSGCTAAGPKGCRVCKSGWVMQHEDGGCVDIDECAEAKHNCSENQFCVNKQGSFSCLECDRACKGCTGDGPDLCNECAEGYELRDGICKDINVTVEEDEDTEVGEEGAETGKENPETGEESAENEEEKPETGLEGADEDDDSLVIEDEEDEKRTFSDVPDHLREEL